MHSKSQNLVLIANHNWLSTYLKFHLTSNPILIYAQGTQFLCHLLSLISTDSNICFWAFSHFHNIINSKLPKKKNLELFQNLFFNHYWNYNIFKKKTCLGLQSIYYSKQYQIHMLDKKNPLTKQISKDNKKIKSQTVILP